MTPPEFVETPARVYGVVEPMGREVFLAPPVPRRVVEIYVKEGDTLKTNQPILRLESELEQQEVEIARLRLAEMQAQHAMTLDQLKRKKTLSGQNAIPEFEYSQLKLKAEYEKAVLKRLQGELKRAETQLNRLTLRAPLNGVLYKFDVRLGEYLTPQDYRRIVIGSPQKQARLFVEVYWRDRFQIGDQLLVKDSETMDIIGKARVIQIAPYVGSRDFRTEDPSERLDVKYQQVIVEVESNTKIPIGLLVLTEKLEK
ncbi:hypothetical protein D6779_06410 [Candidatus Parcubacteria bacterium]|nr:MAG: hypothetical protein D6779_06410 [Candidatus Parcubacteria bacterium]